MRAKELHPIRLIWREYSASDDALCREKGDSITKQVYNVD